MDKKKIKKLLFATTIILMISAIIYIYFMAPIPVNLIRGTDPVTGEFFNSDASWFNELYSYYIAYFHIPIALTAYFAFTIVLISSILYLKRNDQKWDLKAVASAEVGVLFAALTLITGSIWAGAAWNGNYWPPGDVRLNTSLVLFLIYISYLAIRQAIDMPEKRARLSAVFGIIGFISIPISFYSIRLWSATNHPTVVGGESSGGFQGNVIIVPILLNLAAFILLCISLIIYKADNLTLEEDIMAIKQEKGV